MKVKPFPGHLAIWYEEENRRNPGWRDFPEPDEKATFIAECADTLHQMHLGLESRGLLFAEVVEEVIRRNALSVGAKGEI
jgi:hypothetical protein